MAVPLLYFVNALLYLAGSKVGLMIKQYPRLVIAGTNSGVGKALYPLGLCKLGYSVQGI